MEVVYSSFPHWNPMGKGEEMKTLSRRVLLKERNSAKKHVRAVLLRLENGGAQVPILNHRTDVRVRGIVYSFKHTAFVAGSV